MKNLIRFADYAGMAASALCLVHCLAMPLLLVAFPLLGLGGEHHAFHDVLIAGVTVPAIVALVPGYLSHRDASVLLLGAGGVIAFLAAVFVAGPRFGELAEALVAMGSSGLMLSAHMRNHRFCRQCALARGTARKQC